MMWVAQSLTGLSALLLGLMWAIRSHLGRGWPITSPTDAAAAIGSMVVLWLALSPILLGMDDRGPVGTAISLGLLTYGLVGFPDGPVTEITASTSSVISDALTLCGGSLLALAAATSITQVIYSSLVQHGASVISHHQQYDSRSELLVRLALVCLAVGLAIDTWWLQEIGLGSESDAQQAGIAIAWMVYFVALRLRANPRWRGWPWASFVTVGFLCTLPILLDVSWLDAPLSI
jgi:hypothetical protein